MPSHACYVSSPPLRLLPQNLVKGAALTAVGRVAHDLKDDWETLLRYLQSLETEVQQALAVAPVPPMLGAPEAAGEPLQAAAGGRLFDHAQVGGGQVPRNEREAVRVRAEWQQRSVGVLGKWQVDLLRVEARQRAHRRKPLGVGAQLEEPIEALAVALLVACSMHEALPPVGEHQHAAGHGTGDVRQRPERRLAAAAAGLRGRERGQCAGKVRGEAALLDVPDVEVADLNVWPQ
mmetsp:Transcript_87703/g.277246  ORF Transcript_87703/g.277246 Transcript_87703/m.277246 type:complete len:234 (+) Transcript_87703:89-790(+)